MVVAAVAVSLLLLGTTHPHALVLITAKLREASYDFGHFLLLDHAGRSLFFFTLQSEYYFLCRYLRSPRWCITIPFIYLSYNNNK